MQKALVTALLAAAFAVSTSASAETISLTGSFGNKLATNTYDTVFKSNLTGQYDVNSLSYSFTFTDFGDTAWSHGNAYNIKNGKPSNYSLAFPWFVRDVTNTQHVNKTSQQETAALMFGNTVLDSGGTEKKTSTDKVNVNTQTTDGIVCSWFYCSLGFTDVTTTTTYHKTDYTGPFTISGIIDDKNIIDQLIGTGELSLSLKVFGNLLLTGGGIVMDYTTVEAPAEVPEPSSLLLAGAGLAAVGFARRRRTAAKA